MLRIIFWAEPAFSLLEPAITSGPTSTQITRPASSAILPCELQVIPIVFAPTSSAFCNTPNRYLGLPLAEITTHISLSVKTSASLIPALKLSSAPSTAE